MFGSAKFLPSSSFSGVKIMCTAEVGLTVAADRTGEEKCSDRLADVVVDANRVDRWTQVDGGMDEDVIFMKDEDRYPPN